MLFKPLTLPEIERVVDLLVEDLRQRLADRRLKLKLTEAARRHIAAEGFDPVYGARPLRRYLQHQLETRIGRALLAGDVPDGATLTVDVTTDGHLTINPNSPLDTNPAAPVRPTAASTTGQYRAS
jgi:ATP-dependent Clp protease ATP-binding subunit ClpB